MNNPNKPLTCSQAAAILRCSSNHVRKMCSRGLIPHWLAGSQRRFDRAVVERFAAERFAAEHNAPVLRPFVLMVAAVEPAEPFVEAATACQPGVRWSADSPLAIAHLAGSDPPDAVLIGCDNGLGIAVKLAAILLGTSRPPAVAIVLGSDGDPWDDRLSAVRSRLVWLGMEPPSWDGVLSCLGLLPRTVTDAGKETQAASEPDGVLARG